MFIYIAAFGDFISWLVGVVVILGTAFWFGRFLCIYSGLVVKDKIKTWKFKHRDC